MDLRVEKTDLVRFQFDRFVKRHPFRREARIHPGPIKRQDWSSRLGGVQRAPSANINQRLFNWQLRRTGAPERRMLLEECIGRPLETFEGERSKSKLSVRRFLRWSKRPNGTLAKCEFPCLSGEELEQIVRREEPVTLTQSYPDCPSVGRFVKKLFAIAAITNSNQINNQIANQTNETNERFVYRNRFESLVTFCFVWTNPRLDASGCFSLLNRAPMLIPKTFVWRSPVCREVVKCCEERKTKNSR